MRLPRILVLIICDISHRGRADHGARRTSLWGQGVVVIPAAFAGRGPPARLPRTSQRAKRGATQAPTAARSITTAPRGAASSSAHRPCSSRQNLRLEAAVATAARPADRSATASIFCRALSMAHEIPFLDPATWCLIAVPSESQTTSLRCAATFHALGRELSISSSTLRWCDHCPPIRITNTGRQISDVLGLTPGTSSRMSCTSTLGWTTT